MKPGIKVLILLVCTATALTIYALWGPEQVSEYSPRKLDLSCLEQTQSAAEPQIASVSAAVSPSSAAEKERKRETPDTSAQNILFFGDSMLEGLCRRFIDYTEQNGHKLHTVVWYSSSSEIWAKTDTLQHFIRKFRPTYIVVCLGSNELFVRDIDNRKKCIRRIVEKIGDIPFVWISPPNWKKDTGINEAIIEVVGRDRYFDSTHLKLERGADHAHPTFPAAAQWMDLIAKWMESDSVRHPIVMKWPERDLPPRDVTALKPYTAL